MTNPFESFNNKKGNTSEAMDPQTELEQSTLLFRAYEILFQDVINEGEKLKAESLNAPSINESMSNPELMDTPGESKEDIEKKLKKRIAEAKKLEERLQQLVDEFHKLYNIIPNNPQDN